MKRSQEETKLLIQSWLEDWGTFLGILNQWTVTIEFVSAKKLQKDSVAEIDWPPNYRKAIIHFNKSCLSQHWHTDEELEQSIVHELCHLLFADLWDTARKYLDGPIFDEFKNEIEKAIDIQAIILIRMRDAGQNKFKSNSSIRKSKKLAAKKEIISTNGIQIKLIENLPGV